jgi:GNAT superfamily N-acetyltransferase
VTALLPVTVRVLPRSDAGHAVDTVFAGLSPTSRLHRFHTPVPRLTGAMRERLTDIDGRRRAAVVAEADGTPVGIARLAGDGGGSADMAMAVVDAWHRRGVGTRLATALADLAAEIGYTELRGMVLPENVAMLELARRTFPWARRHFDGDVIELHIRVGEWTITEEDIVADLLSR